MKFVSDKVEGVSPGVIAFAVGASLLSILPVAFLLIKMNNPSLTWSESSSDYKILWGSFILVLLTMGAMLYMFLTLKVETKGNGATIEARIYPFMRSFRVIHLSDVKSLEIAKIDGFMKYGGVGYKNNLGGQTSYTVTGHGNVLKIKLKNKKELHVQITKQSEWKRYISDFKNQSV